MKKVEQTQSLSSSNKVYYVLKVLHLAPCNPEGESRYDEDFRQRIEREVKEMERDSYNRRDDVTVKSISNGELSKAPRQLKNRKAPGSDGITNEHLKNIGPITKRAILLLFNSMIWLEHVPSEYKKGVIIPIPKGGGKDASIKDNNRGITLLSCVYKLFESILLTRLDGWLRDRGVIHELQGAFQEKCSCQHTSTILQETIQHNRERGSTVYVVFLDVRKAFDTVWTDGLLYRLYNIGMEGKLWRLLRDCYGGFRYSVLVNGHTSMDFKVGRGVHQGAPMSMRLYQ